MSIWAATFWFFADETEQANGPWKSKGTATRACTLYGYSLDRDLTEDEIKELKSLRPEGYDYIFRY